MKKSIKPKETSIQYSILEYLRRDRRVVWAERFNSGQLSALNRDGSSRVVRFGFTGCADILGQLTDGRILAIEVKTPTGKLSNAQRDFLLKVSNNGGVGCVARSSAGAKNAIDLAFTK